MNLREWVKHEDDIIAHVFERIESWRAAGHPPAQTYFTSGLERQVAIMIERAVADERAVMTIEGDRLRGALAWYADVDNYPSTVVEDFGHCARRALGVSGG